MKVSFLIAGVQKGATTALRGYLRRHPDLWFPEAKELHFFDDEDLDWREPPYAAYHEAFRGAPPALLGEATPIYTYWRPSAERIRAYNPRIKLIVSLRDPAARAYSHWRMETARDWESMDFSSAIREGRRRVAAGAEIAGQHRVFSYVERGFYVPQIERLLALFPRDRLLFVTRVGLLRRREATLDEICDFLEVPRFAPHPPHETAHSHDGAGLPPPAPGDVAYLRDLYRDDTERAQALVGREIEPEPP